MVQSCRPLLLLLPVLVLIPRRRFPRRKLHVVLLLLLILPALTVRVVIQCPVHRMLRVVRRRGRGRVSVVQAAIRRRRPGVVVRLADRLGLCVHPGVARWRLGGPRASPRLPVVCVLLLLLRLLRVSRLAVPSIATGPPLLLLLLARVLRWL